MTPQGDGLELADEIKVGWQIEVTHRERGWGPWRYREYQAGASRGGRPRKIRFTAKSRDKVVDMAKRWIDRVEAEVASREVIHYAPGSEATGEPLSDGEAKSGGNPRGEA